ncbi:myeloid-derived growth factor [Thalassophryne amazonica]|uniref:myeloid-derived growth factor n=1 Tax=Thalassophryne amazonica TaxID=390379 RepID=UPI0014717558|nr:myeloid-derived growth factor [Thalassophryne amazonica]
MMARHSNFSSVSLTAGLVLYVLFCVFELGAASSERVKTVEFDVKPGGEVHTFTKGIGDCKCSFTYASQGGTNEQWLMSMLLNPDGKLFSCNVWRPQGKSYLFFTQFKAELTGAKIEYAMAYSQTAESGQSDVPLKPEEFTVGESTVTHTEGKFRAELSKLTLIGLTPRAEL